MAKANYITQNHRANCNTFGGLVYPSDFNTECCNGNTASRIYSDLKFDEMCKKNCINKYKAVIENGETTILS